MTLISLAMIVKNEEATLAHCLESVKPLADEIIIVDTGSTDKTIDIAKSFGARIHHFKWCDNFAAARNESLKYCKGDWALIMDADEAIDPLDYEKIKNACIRPWADIYSLICRHYTFKPNLIVEDSRVVPNKSKYAEGKGMPFYGESRITRLARRMDGLSFNGSIHEKFGESVLSQGKTIAELDAVVHHYGKLFDDREEHKAQYYLMLAKREAEKAPNDSWAQSSVLMQALNAKQWKTALNAAMAIMKHDAYAKPFVVYGCGQALQELGRHKEAIKYFDLLLRQDPKHVMAMLFKASSYKALGNANIARQLLMKAIELEPALVPAHGRLADLEFSLNNFDAARQAVLNAIKIAPNEPGLYDDLLRIEMARNNHQQAARDALLGLQNCPNGGNGVWHRLAAVYLLQTGEREAAKSILESGIEVFPGDPDMVRLMKMISAQSVNQRFRP
jgi:glycosyltransferase involved in cell wall biosynthesis